MSARKRIPYLQVITDEEIQDRHSHLEIARHALRGGADAVQFREKRPWTTRELMQTAREILDEVRRYESLLIVDDRVDVARSVGASAVHLGRHDLDVVAARAILGPDAIIGGTANSYEEAERVWQSDIDYLGVGPVYGTRTKRNPAPEMGLETLARICAACPVPVIAIGSITAERIPEVLHAGAHGVAVVSAVVTAPDLEAATRRCVEVLEATRAGDSVR